jgi:hypothetical protein
MSGTEVQEVVDAGRHTWSLSLRKPARQAAWTIEVVRRQGASPRKQYTGHVTPEILFKHLTMYAPGVEPYSKKVFTRLKMATQAFQQREVWVELKPARWDNELPTFDWVVEVLSHPDWYARNQQEATRYLDALFDRITRAARSPKQKGLFVRIEKLE